MTTPRMSLYGPPSDVVVPPTLRLAQALAPGREPFVAAIGSLPGATLYGVWQGKQTHHWQDEAIVVEPRSPKLEPILERDKQIVTAFEG